MKRFVVVMTVWAMGLAGVLAGVVFPGSASAAPVIAAATAASGSYTPLATARVFDKTVTTAQQPVQIAGVKGVPQDATAVMVNTQVFAPTVAGYVRVTPFGQDAGVATQQFVKGQTISNLVAVKLVGGKAQVRVSAGSARILMDVSGYYGAADVTPSISGTVIDAGTERPLANVRVSVYSPSTGYSAPTATTVANGNWSVTRLPAATDYGVCFFADGATGGSSDARGYVNECYASQPNMGTATPVTVVLGETTPGINAALLGAGAISGTVTNAGGQPLVNVKVSVYSPSNPWFIPSPAITQANGGWSVTGLPAGTDFQVCFNGYRATGGSPKPNGYANQCYAGQPSWQTSTRVTVVLGQTTPGINAALDDAGAV
jgi:hypothetical protein